jgi:3-oxoacyl-[acyl-carrier-protein] synthase III
MNCYITATGSFLPGDPIPNEAIPLFLGELDGEAQIRSKILRMNGIKSRHYALDENQNPTHDLYDLAVCAAETCLASHDGGIGYLSAGSTNAPLVGPGISSLIHHRLAGAGLIGDAVEINSNSGICTASSQALVNACRAVASGDHRSALCIGVEQPSAILKSSVIQPVDDRALYPDSITESKWFMSVFLRSMLSDGAGALLVQDRPLPGRVCYQINWTYSRSFAHETPLCMKLESRTLLLSQDVSILTKHMKPCISKLLNGALTKHGDDLSSYRVILPHLSSYFFKPYMMSVLKELCPERVVDHWTNLQSAGNTGAASIYIILDEYTRQQSPADGEKILLFIPESGQFNFVLVSLTVVNQPSIPS